MKAVQGDEEESTVEVENPKLKIGQLAKAAGETVPTIRFWTKEGLLQVAEVSESGYQFYDPAMIDCCRKILALKKKRMTLAEIKTQLES